MQTFGKSKSKQESSKDQVVIDRYQQSY